MSSVGSSVGKVPKVPPSSNSDKLSSKSKDKKPEHKGSTSSVSSKSSSSSALIPRKLYVSPFTKEGICFNSEVMKRMGIKKGDYVLLNNGETPQKSKYATVSFVRSHDDTTSLSAVRLDENVRDSLRLVVGEEVWVCRIPTPNDAKSVVFRPSGSHPDLDSKTLLSTYIGPFYHGTALPLHEGDIVSIDPDEGDGPDDTLPTVEFRISNLDPGPAALVAPDTVITVGSESGKLRSYPPKSE